MGFNDIDIKVSGGSNIISTLQTYTTRILKPNIVDGKNVLTQEMLSSKNTKYVIKYNYELLDATLTMPQNVILEFDGGSIKNGTLVGNDTLMLNTNETESVLDNVTLDGTWKESSYDLVEEVVADKAPGDGMGRIILRKDKTFAEQLTQENTIYVIRYDFELSEDVTIPANCVLQFDGGSLSGNVTITGTNTRIKSPTKRIFNSNITLLGTFIDFCIDWLLDDDENDVAPFVTKVWAITNSVTFMKKAYTFRSEAKVYGSIYAQDATFDMYTNGCLTIENTKNSEVSIQGINVYIKTLNGHSSAAKGLYIRSLSCSNVTIRNLYYFTEECVLIETGKKTISGVEDNINREVALNTFQFDWMSDAPILINVYALENGWVNENRFINSHFAGGEYKASKPLGANKAMVWNTPTTFSYNHNHFSNLCCEGVEGVLFEFNKINHSVIDFFRFEAGTSQSKIIFKNGSFANRIQDCYYDMGDRIDSTNNDGIIWGEYVSIQGYGLRNILSINPMCDFFEEYTDNNVSKIRTKDERIHFYTRDGVKKVSVIGEIYNTKDIKMGDNSGGFFLGCDINTQEFKTIFISHLDDPVRSIHVRYLEINNVPVNYDMQGQVAPKSIGEDNSIIIGNYNENFKTFYFENRRKITLFVPSNVTKISVYLMCTTNNVFSSLDILAGSPFCIIGCKKSGPTTDRPISVPVGFVYYDNTLEKPIFYKGLGIWVDGTGIAV